VAKAALGLARSGLVAASGDTAAHVCNPDLGEPVRPLLTLASLAAALLLSACASTVPLSRNQLATLSAESRPAEVEAAIGQSTPKHTFTLDTPAGPMAVRVFNLLIGSRSQMMTVCTPNCMLIPTQVPVTTDFVIVQQADSKALRAWGTLEEIGKDADPRVSALAAPIRERVAALERSR
jgi:hypothetical protein